MLEVSMERGSMLSPTPVGIRLAAIKPSSSASAETT